jgi:hypothetical protein
VAATSNPVAKPARPVTAAEPQVGRLVIRHPLATRSAGTRTNSR